MPSPNFPEKHTAAPLVTPRRFLDYARASGRLVDFTPPKGVLLVYRRSLAARLVETYAADPPTSIGAFAIRTLPGTGGAVGLAGDFGIGGPIVSTIPGAPA